MSAIIDNNQGTTLDTLDGLDVDTCPKDQTSIYTTSDNEVIIGDDGRNILVGGDGNDILMGNDSRDFLRGGEGQDVFVLDVNDSGVDKISDFNTNDDFIIIEGVSSSSDVKYDSATGHLSVNGETIAELDTDLDFSDDNYDVF